MKISQSDRNQNICEFTIIGTVTHENYRHVLENLCLNYYASYLYEVTTFTTESQEGLKHLSNTVELHMNMNENYRTGEYITDNEEFYNNVDYFEKLDEYITISRCFLKYITNAFVSIPYGSVNIVELSRCEENIELILKSLGYKEKSKIRKNGGFVRYKNEPIAIIVSNIEKLDDNLNNLTPNAPTPKKSPLVVEIIGYCYETQKEQMMKTLEDIKKELSGYYVFEGDF